MEAAVRWSPHSTGDRRRFLIVDVAESSLILNEISKSERDQLEYHAVSQCNRLPAFGAFAWSPVQEQIVALGLVSGNACLVRLGEDKQSSEPFATFRTKQQRKCNSIAFNTQNWLAVASDKTRSDACLNIYDASGGESTSLQEPVRRLCAGELVSSVRFFPSQPQELVASIQRSYIRTYDLRDGYISGGHGNLQAATRNVHNVTIDPLDENYFASAGPSGDPSVTVWDRRWMTQSSSSGSNSGAVFNFSPAVDIHAPTTVWSLRYSGQCRGRLAIHSSTGELRVVDMVEGCLSSTHSSEYAPVNPYGGTPWSTNRYISRMRKVQQSSHQLGNVHINDDGSRVIAFDWVSEETASGKQAMVALRPNGRVQTFKVPSADTYAEVTACQDLNMVLEDLTVCEARPSKAISDIPQERTSFSYEEGTAAVQCSRDSPLVGKLLASSTTQRKRCRHGYLFDCHKNMQMVAGNWPLERLWEILGRFKEHAADEGMVYDSLDMSYIGVSGLWSEKIGNKARRQLSPSPTRVEKAIVGLNNRRELPAFEGERTSFPEHRQLCLAACGWKFTIDALEAECQEMIDRGLYYQAIIQAVLHDYRHFALNLLRTLIRSKTIPNIGLGALLASDGINDEQREMCLWMAADTEDPALKALLTFLITDDWRDVMKTNYLHLCDRVGLGLKYLNDTELSGFIQTETARAVRNGDVEGVLLTGLGGEAMDLFQAYITKTNDLQTAVLATAFTNPLYVDDARWEMWKETYFMQMQSWRSFNERTKFTVQYSRMARWKDGSTWIEPPTRPVTLRCNHCKGSLARRDGETSGRGIKVTGPLANAGTVCSSCGRHMPRCALCQLWLGTPDLTKAGRIKDMSKLEDTMAKFISFCVSCGHGFHADHAKAWFGEHEMCPVPDCQCMCGLT